MSMIGAPCRVYDLIEGMDTALNDPSFAKRIKDGHPGMNGPSQIYSIEYLVSQKA
ncbi:MULTISPECIES: hypothetical protein [Asaia]|uniref:hypothetical protein n=1 Tax=Asaia TaxID=91914 RepID=UPI002FC2CDD6